VILDIPIYLSAHKDKIPLVYATYFTSFEVWSYTAQHARNFHNSTDEDSVLSVYGAVSMGPKFPTSEMIALPSYLEPKVQ